VNAAAAAVELLTTLTRVETALAAGDSEGAAVDMNSAADLCRRLQAAGMGVPPAELGALRDLWERCGMALTQLGENLNAESFRDDNHRRGVGVYQDSLRR
jgi:hypothetical protein